MPSPIVLSHRPKAGPVAQIDYEVDAGRLELQCALTGRTDAYAASYDTFLGLVCDADELPENLNRIASSRHTVAVACGDRLSDRHPQPLAVDAQTLPIIPGKRLRQLWQRHQGHLQARAWSAAWSGALYG